MGERSRFKCPKCGSHDEAKRKAAAEALRELAAHYRVRGYEASDYYRGAEQIVRRGVEVAWREVADEAERRADALWPRKKGGRS